MWHSFSRSYGVILPSSLTRVISRALGFSPRLPVSVLVRSPNFLPRSFSCQCGVNSYKLAPRHRTSGLTNKRICQFVLPTYLHHNPISGLPILLCHSLGQMKFRWYRNINLLSIDYAFRPHLRSDLP